MEEERKRRSLLTAMDRVNDKLGSSISLGAPTSCRKEKEGSSRLPGSLPE